MSLAFKTEAWVVVSVLSHQCCIPGFHNDTQILNYSSCHVLVSTCRFILNILSRLIHVVEKIKSKKSQSSRLMSSSIIYFMKL